MKPKKLEAPPMPECEKMVLVRDKSQVVGDFIEWLNSTRGLVLCEYIPKHEEGKCYRSCEDPCTETKMVRAWTDIEELLSEFFGIDLNKVEKERRALLKYIREKDDVK